MGDGFPEPASAGLASAAARKRRSRVVLLNRRHGECQGLHCRQGTSVRHAAKAPFAKEFLGFFY
jgi:hypothetical protein